MAATSTLSSELQTTSGVERDSEPGLDAEVLREGARTGLINALNSVRPALWNVRSLTRSYR